MTSLLDGSTEPEISSYQDLLVGEGKKFSDMESLAKGKYQSDEYVKTLERQLDEYRKDLIKEREENTLRAEFDKLKEQFSRENNQLTKSAQQSNTTQQPAEVKPINQDDIKSLVSSTVQEMENSKKRDSNFNLVVDKLTERFGKNYQSILEQQIKALNLTVEEANELARSKPQLLLKTLGMDAAPQRENFQTPPRTNTNTSSFKPEVKKRDWNYYQELKQKNPKEYYSAKTNVQMHNDMLDLGEQFMTGDFRASDKELLRSLRGY